MELNLGQKVHLARRNLKSILNYTYISLSIGIIITVLVLLIGIPSIQFIESFGVWENRLDSIDGPICNPGEYTDPSLTPAAIRVIQGTGAEESGIQYGDIITKINDLEIPHVQSLKDDWPAKLPDVKPGDTVEVLVNRNGESLSFLVKTTPNFDDSSKPMIGVEYLENICTLYFVSGANFAQSDLELVLLGLWAIVIIVIVFGIVVIFGIIFYRSKINKLNQEIEEWEGDYLDENYYLAFETNVPTGKTNGEKIFRMAQLVFPELRKKDLSPEKWKGEIVGAEKFVFDCFQTTNDDKQVFVAKHFGDEKIDKEKLQELSNTVKESLKMKTLGNKIKDLEYKEIMRIVCVGNNYDEKLLEDESRDEILDSIDTEYLFDLILEKDERYTVLQTEY